ncbi:hypothetical protein [Roseiflexus sp.]|uniref:hypothetical protein n=1 Tax=Roseiflexus sp. TaxID=2562120 RepID=UPI0021DEE4D6|nr:hypothetical protein [Roseiflexus sp.]GIW00619.1 MAG: hypothetical protein KatS3mg058_2022 [Roseiflexus sp.]
MMRLFLAIVLLAALMAPGASHSAAAQSPVLPATVYPSSGPAGTRFDFLADGFQSGERIDIWVNAPDGRALPARPDSELQRRVARDGRAAWSWTSPNDIQPGMWSLVARGQRSGAVRVGLFTILPPAAPAAPDANAFPATGRPGTRFVFFAAGFAADDPIGFFLSAPDGEETPVAVEQPRIFNGRVDWAWTAPDNAAPGVWRFRVRGGNSRFEQTLAVTIERPTATVGVTPGRGRAGTLFQFFAEGLQGREGVVFWFNRPDGRAEKAMVERVAINDGRVEWSWIAPDDAQPGQWSMVARGVSSGIERVVLFEIR